MPADGPLLSSLVAVMGAIRHAELSTVPVALADLVNLIEQQIPVVNYAGIAVPARRVERTPAAVITEHPVIAMLHDAERMVGQVRLGTPPAARTPSSSLTSPSRGGAGRSSPAKPLG